MKTTYVMAVRCYRPDGSFETCQYEVEAVDLKTGMQNALDKAFSKMIPFTPERVEIKPQRHFVNNAPAVDDASAHNPAYFKLRSCTAKKAYPYKEQAQKDADQMNVKRKPAQPIQSVYTCGFCKFFHVGGK
jgi:hypothetical protein